MLTEHLSTAWQDLVATVTGVVPRIAMGIVAAIVLVLTAKFIRRMTSVACRRVQVDRLSDSLGLAALVSRLGVRQPASEWIPAVVYAGTLLLFAQTGATVLGLAPIADSIRAFFAYLPNVIAAIAVLLAGSAAAEFAGQAVRRAADDSGIDLAPTLGSVSSALILFVTGIMALAQLRIDTEMIRIVTICALGGIALAFGLSLGLGSREVTRNMIAGFYARKVLRPGDTVTMGERTGTLVMITPTQTVIALPADEELAVSNGVYLDAGSGVVFSAADRSRGA
ncbi:MAG: mechanosensitive ion channel [Acidobacteria bacterium]|nr:mechanosensitive ion channel [Acidobacteriota bacterium]